MRRFLSALILLGASAGLRAGEAPRPASADEAALLREAIKHNHQDTEHWAYTETTQIVASKGSPQGATVVRFDPSKPYAEQFTPLKVDGQPPTERQLRKYRERGEKRGEKLARDAAAASDRPAGAPPALNFNGSKANLDLDHSRVTEDGPERISFEIPLVGRRQDIPMNKFELRMQVQKKSRQVETVTLRLREPFRVKLIAKLKAGEARLDFTVVDPAYPPVISSITGNLGLSILFIPVDATFANTRTEWKRVKAYDERFSVKLGPMQFLDI